MACRDFGINEAEEQSPQHRNHGNRQQQGKRDDHLFLHHLISWHGLLELLGNPETGEHSLLTTFTRGCYWCGDGGYKSSIG
jgi:hypothetical protein